MGSPDIIEEHDPYRIIRMALNSALDRSYISKAEYERAALVLPPVESNLIEEVLLLEHKK